MATYFLSSFQIGKPKFLTNLRVWDGMLSKSLLGSIGNKDLIVGFILTDGTALIHNIAYL